MLEETPGALVVDAGHLLFKGPQVPEGERAERELKARLIAEATRLGGIDAMMPARSDFALGRAFVEELGRAHALPYVVSNLECGTPLPWPTELRLSRGGVNFVVYGVVSGALNLPACRPSDPARALAGAPADDTVVVVLSDQERAQDDDLVSRVPAIDLVVVSNAASPLRSPESLPNGGLRLSNGSRGKLLGLLRGEIVPGARGWRDEGTRAQKAEEIDNARERLAEIERREAAAADDEARQRLSRQREFWTKKLSTLEAELAAATSPTSVANVAANEVKALGDDVADHGPTLAMVEAVKAKISGGSVSPSTVTAGPEPEAEVAPPVETGVYVGSASCAACHPAQTAQWSTTPHARAWASLVAVNRQFDSDCWRCHATGAHAPDGPQDPRALGPLENVGCEACHGAGRAHAADPSLPMVLSPPTSQCTQCHDKKQDDGRFDESTYRPKVLHTAP